MMQSSASAAKLRGGGPILNRGSNAMCNIGLPPPGSVALSGGSRERVGAPLPPTPDPRTLLMTDARAFRGFRVGHVHPYR